jgi:hypothetical protein
MGLKRYLTFREENKLRVNKENALRKKVRFKREEVKGGWRKMHN